jgi:activator of HSP90 ATPase
METGVINQSITFECSTQMLYNILMDEKLHSIVTDGLVEMSNEVGGKFSVFDGYCSGYNIELEVGNKIVQAWNFKEDGWPADHYSICTFIFKPISDGCLLTFSQTNIPEHKVEALKEGWTDYYWEPIKTYLKNIR